MSADGISKGWSVCVNSSEATASGGRFPLRSSDRKADLHALDSHRPALVRHESGQGLCVLSCLKVYWEQEKERKKNLCKLSWWTLHFFPQPVQRGKHYINEYLIGLRVTSLEFSNTGSMLANLESRWHLLQQTSPNSVLHKTSPCFTLCLHTALLLLSLPHTKVPHREVASLGSNLSSRSVFLLFLQSAQPSIKTHPSRYPCPLDPPHTSSWFILLAALSRREFLLLSFMFQLCNL